MHYLGLQSLLRSIASDRFGAGCNFIAGGHPTRNTGFRRIAQRVSIDCAYELVVKVFP